MIYESAIRRLIKFKGSCCSSCHEDLDEFGNDMIYLELEGHGDGQICCTVSMAFDKFCSDKILRGCLVVPKHFYGKGVVEDLTK